MTSQRQSELMDFLKRKRKFMTVKEISKETGDTATTINRKLKRVVGRKVEMKQKSVHLQGSNRRFNVRFYRYKK